MMMMSFLFPGLPTSCRAVGSGVASSDDDDEVAVARRRRLRQQDDGSSPVASPVQIPRRQHVGCRKRYERHPRAVEPVAPSLAALLAVTDIPRPRRRSWRRSAPVVVSDELDSETGLGPLELLLSPPEDFADAAFSSECALARTTSADSIPSLGGESTTSDTLSSLETPPAIADCLPPRLPSVTVRRRRRLSPVRRSLPSDAADGHPLVAHPDASDSAADDADDERPADEAPKQPRVQLPLRPLRSVFRSNLTASLRALRSAARSLSSSGAHPPPVDPLLVGSTRSILSIDPSVPYTDERRPPVLEEMPSAELRRYLNPTTGSLIGTQPAGRCPRRAYSASIQMQTYKVYRSRTPPSPQRSSPLPPLRAGSPAPGMRQREIRENPDFIRVAVLEMAMRRAGKLDGQRPGRARWALPPRRPVTRPYEIGANGVPVRWTPALV